MQLFIRNLFLIAAISYAGISHAQECDSVATTIASSPLMSQQPGAVTAARKLQQEIPKSADIVFLGDSQLYGWSKDLREDFKGEYVWNFSVPGDRTQQLIWRLNAPGLNVLKPSVVLVLIGTNNFGDYGMKACSIFSGIKTVVEKGKQLWPDAKIVVLTIPPRGADFQTFKEERVKLNEMIKGLYNSSRNIFAVEIDDNDFTCNLYQNPDSIAACAAPGTSACSNYKPDHLHFERPGYLSLRHTLADWSQRQFKSDVFSRG